MRDFVTETEGDDAVNDLRGATVLVTGAGGFIGSHLTEELVRRGASVRAFVRYNSRSSIGLLSDVPSEIRDKIEIVSGDITDPWSVRSAMDDRQYVFHLAALIAIPYSYVAPASYLAANASGTLNVLQAARDLGTHRVVHTSTSETYGTAIYTPIDEQHPLQGQSPYSASKIAADKLAESFWRSFETPVSTIRPFNTYGPRQSARAVIPTIASQLLSGAQYIRLGSLDPIRDLTFVKDTAAGFIAVALADECIGTVTNVGNGKGISIGDLAALIASLAGRDGIEIRADEQRVRPSKSEVFELISDARLAAERAGWQPSYTLEQGLSETIDYVRDNLDRYRPAEYTV